MALGERLRKSRERVGLVQEQAAQVLGVPREMISMWENGSRNPSYRQLEALSGLYRVNVGYLLGEEELNERYELDMLYRWLPDDHEIQVEVERWVSFLDDWADFREESGDELPGFGKPPRDLNENGMITDARRAPTLAAKVRKHYRMGQDATPDLYAFLDEEDVLVYRAELGSVGKGSEGVSGAFYNHPRLGYCIMVNAQTTPGRQTFTLAHEFAHALYHHAVGGIISRKGDQDPKERFANAFAAHFLVPAKELRRLVEDERRDGGMDPYQALMFAAYFRVSYATLLTRLREEHLIDPDTYLDYKGYSPSSMAWQIGLDPEEFRVPEPRPLYLKRYPVSVLWRVKRAVEEDQLTDSQAADLLDVDVVTLRRQLKLLSNPPKATQREVEEFDELVV